jgi:putative inorganic carbon (HCO3(-)) transporter
LVVNAGFQYFNGFDLFRHFRMGEDLRLRASFSNANDMAGWLILFLPLLISIAFLRERLRPLKRTCLMIISFLTIICLVLGYSRGALLGFFIAFMFIFAYYRKKAIPLIVFLIITLLFVLLTPLKNMYYLNIFKGHGSVSVFIRLDLWKRILAMIADYPLLGSGPSTYVPIIGRYSKDFYPDTSYPHNSYLHITAETGLVGLFAFIWIFATLFNTAYRKLKETKTKSEDNIELVGLLSGLIAFLVHSFFDTNLASLLLVTSFWVVVALTVSLLKIREVS